MRLTDSFRTAFGGVTHAKLRSALTMLGIVIGVASVIVLLSIGDSAQKLIIGQVEGIGSNLIFIVPGGSGNSRTASPASTLGVIIKTLVSSDITALKRDPSITDAVPQVQGMARVVYGNNDKNTQYSGVGASYFSIRNIGVTRGAAFTDADSDSFNKVAVLGPSIAKDLFENEDPIGKIIRLKDVSFRVIGITESKGLGVGGVDQDSLILIPLQVAQKQLLGINYFNFITIQANPAYTSEYTKQRVISILREEHRITDPAKDDFTVRTQADALAILGTITSAMTLFLAAIASVSLIVGGIGIMNIMLVSVVERTREIGLRKAVGATEKDILQQFLLEAVMLTTVGGIIGVLVGALLTVVAYFAIITFSGISWTFSLPLRAVLMGVGVAAGTGIVFGVYPARDAAKKSPIEALRYE
jgi:putative ABC transport system permease protein